MQTYTTQMDAARKGIITPQMEIVAKKEYRTPEEIRQLVAEGKVAIRPTSITNAWTRRASAACCAPRSM